MSFRSLVKQELARARYCNPPMNSPHEAFAIILEEVDELKAEVWRRPKDRNPERMLAELIQIGAMAQRMAEDLDLLNEE